MPGCLESVQELVGEIVLVDTGSTDETLKIARRFGARIIRTRWENHFAHARNLALQHAAYPWILYLDADERLHPQYHPIVRRAIQSGKADAFYVQIYSPVNGRLGSTPHIQTYPRLFRKMPGVQFEGRIHEQITPALQRAGARFANLDVRIEHLGYQLDETTLSRKIKRNIHFLEVQVREEPHNAYAKYQLGQTYILDGQTDRGRVLLQQAIASGNLTTKIEATARLVLANLYLESQKPEQALAQVKQALHIAPRQRLGWFLFAAIQETRKQWVEAAKGLQNYWKYEKEPFTDLGIDKILERPVVLKKFLGILQHIPEHIQEFRSTFQYILATLEEFPEVSPVLQVLSKFVETFSIETWKEALYRKATRLVPDAGIYWTLLGTTCLNRGLWSEARQAFIMGKAKQPHILENYNGLAVVALKQGRFDEALRWFREIARRFPEQAADAYRKMAGIYVKMGKVQEAMKYLQPTNTTSMV